ncbi:hypothetical protein [Streptomyces sp. NPDC002758]
MTLNTSASREAVEITLDEAKTLLARAVEERGADYTYKMLTIDDESLCAYFDPATKECSCIVGQVLSYKGVTFEDLNSEGMNTYANVEALADKGFIKADNEVLALLEIVQSEQDAGMPWGRAVEEALSTYADKAENYDTEGYDAPDWHYYF